MLRIFCTISTSLLFFLLVGSNVSMGQKTLLLERTEIASSEKIVSKPIHFSDRYLCVQYKITPLGIGSSDGKGIRLNYANDQHYIFIAINDDKPIGIYDSQTKTTVASKQAEIVVGQQYEFKVNVLPTGIEVWQASDGIFAKIMGYEKTFGSQFGISLQCQRTGAIFEDVWIEPLD